MLLTILELSWKMTQLVLSDINWISLCFATIMQNICDMYHVFDLVWWKWKPGSLYLSPHPPSRPTCRINPFTTSFFSYCSWLVPREYSLSQVWDELSLCSDLSVDHILLIFLDTDRQSEVLTQSILWWAGWKWIRSVSSKSWQASVTEAGRCPCCMVGHTPHCACVNCGIPHYSKLSLIYLEINPAKELVLLLRSAPSSSSPPPPPPLPPSNPLPSPTPPSPRPPTPPHLLE